MSLVITGGTVADIIVTRLPRLPVWPRHSEFTPANLVLLTEAPLITLGGNGANAAYVAASLGARVDLRTNVGNDALGEVVRGWLEGAGCRLLGSRKTGRTAINITAANARHARATFFYPGAAPVLPSLRDLSADMTHALVCGWPHPPFPQLGRWFRSLRRQGQFTAMDSGPFLGRPWTLAQLDPVLGSLDLLLTNEYELNALTRSVRLSVALRKIRQHFQGHLVVKRGSRGALWLPQSSSQAHLVKAHSVRAVNTVGAGDSFNGALLAGLVQGSEFPQALAQAAKVAARVVASRQGVLGVGT